METVLRQAKRSTSGSTSDQKPKTTRASKPKAKTGCITCKIRRVKCDEAKPECLRCRKFGMKCDGYAIPKQPVSKMKFRHWSIHKGTISSDLSIQSGPLTMPENLFPGVSFRSERDGLYFSSLQNNESPHIIEIFSGSVWKRVILPACHEESFVQDAVVAIAALSVSKLELTLQKTEIDHSTADSKHYEFALRRYGQAISTMRSALATESNPRKALIGCLLVSCFEHVQGQRQQALVHAASGFKMMKSWMVNNSYSFVKIGARCQNAIDDDLIDTISLLYLQALLAFPGIRSLISFQAEMDACQNIASTMPSRFSGVIEASRYWVALMSPFVQFIEMATASANCMNLPSRDDFWKINGYTERLGGELADSLQTPPLSVPISEDIQTYYAMYSTWMKKWQNALRELRLNPGHESEGDKVRHQKLQLLAEVAQIFLQYLVTTDEWAFDQLEDQFRAILAHTKALLRKPLPFVAVKEEYKVAIEVGFLPGLYMVCRFCRNPEIRRDAIALCSKTHGFNDWDVPLVTKIATWLIEMEGEGDCDIENCRTPQRVRVRVAKIFVNPVEKSAYLLYTKRVKGDPEEMTIGEATIKL